MDQIINYDSCDESGEESFTESSEACYLENQADQTIDDIDDFENEDEDDYVQINKKKREMKDYDTEASFEDYDEIVKEIKSGPFLEAEWNFSHVSRTKNSDKYWYTCKYKKVCFIYFLIC